MVVKRRSSGLRPPLLAGVLTPRLEAFTQVESKLSARACERKASLTFNARTLRTFCVGDDPKKRVGIELCPFPL